MADKTKIEWTDATWNPVTGCTKVSPGCDHCYAETIAHRFAGTTAYPNGFEVTLHPERLDAPLRWTRPRRVFVNSMSDLFHGDIETAYIAQVFAVMAMAPEHTFQVLTKRPGRMRSVLSSPSFPELVTTWAWRINAGRARNLPKVKHLFPLPNVWLGTSVEDQHWADIRIPSLAETPAAVRFLSCEPLLGPLDLTAKIWAIRWVIVGGESGHGARPMSPDWVRGIRDQCQNAGVPFFFKQWGEWIPAPWHTTREATDGATHAVNDASAYSVELDHRPWSVERDDQAPRPWSGIRKVGKRAAGREIDGRTWDEMPAAANA